jgi:hypothetical protein
VRQLTLLGCAAHGAFRGTLRNPSQDFYRSIERRRIIGTPTDRLRRGLNFAVPHAVSGLREIEGKQADVLRTPTSDLDEVPHVTHVLVVDEELNP